MAKYSGIYTYLYGAAVMAEYYTTTAANEIISFVKGAAPLAVEEVLIENLGVSAMYVQPIPGDSPVCIPAGESRTFNEITMRGIKVLGDAGQKIRYSGNYN